MSEVAGRMSVRAGANGLEIERGGRGVLLGGVPGVSPGKVTIIGGGVGGLACAYPLRRKGHAVTVFDNHKELGGMMRYGIPGYRIMPPSSL